MYDSSLDNQFTVQRKFAKRWFGPYIVKHVHGNATYTLCELDGTEIKNPVVAGKRIKMFKRRQDSDPFDSQETHEEHIESENMEMDEEEEDDLPGNVDDEDDIQIFVDLNEDLAHTGGCAGLEGVDVVPWHVHDEKPLG